MFSYFYTNEKVKQIANFSHFQVVKGVKEEKKFEARIFLKRGNNFLNGVQNSCSGTNFKRNDKIGY